jgi:hypothetical protein
MSCVTRHYKGTKTGQGVVKVYEGGLPAHMLPSAARLGVGSASQGEQRAYLKDYFFTGDVLNKSVGVTISGTATVAFEGTNDDDPSSVGARWFPLATAVTASSGMNSSIPARFSRLNVSSGTGTATVDFFGQSE